MPLDNPMRPIRHLTPRYVCNRLVLAATQKVHPDWPWLTKQMVTILDTWMLPCDTGIEWGSGRSTLWFAKKARSLVSIEHNPKWFEKIKCHLASVGCSNVDYHLITDIAEYVNAGRSDFDFALVDGIERDACALKALGLLRPGGALIVDNANWFLPAPSGTFSPCSVSTPATDKWVEFLAAVKNWRCIWTSDGVTDTALWIKP
jgi:hypothetical protein